MKFISKEVFLEESAGKRKIFLIMEEKIMEYEKRMLSDSDCPYTLQMHFISDEGAEKVYYDFTGFIQLEEYIKRKTTTDISERESQKMIFDALDIMTKILECLKGMESYLIFPERISIHPDLIFVNLNDGRIAFAFYPNDSKDTPLQGRVIEMIDTISGLYDDVEAALFLEKCKNYIYLKNPGLDGMIGNLGMLQREVSYIFWNTKNFRGEVDKESIDSGEPADKSLSSLFKKPALLQTIVIQALIGAALFMVFLSGRLEIVNFAGLIVIAAALDMLIIRTLRLKLSSS